MEWFKHYNSASDGETISQLLIEKDYEQIAVYWWLLEQISKFEKPEERGKCTLKFSYIRSKLGKNSQSFTKLLLKIGQTYALSLSVCFDTECVQVYAPNWLKLQENRGGKRQAKQKQNDVKTGTDIRVKNKERDSEEDKTREETVKNNPIGSSVSAFNARFHKDAGKWEEFLEKNSLFRFRNKLDLVMARHGTVENAQDWLETIASNKTAKDLSGHPLINYITAAFGKDLGL